LNFKVAPKVHMWFKMEAARRCISMKALLQEMIERYIMEH